MFCLNHVLFRLFTTLKALDDLRIMILGARRSDSQEF